MSIDRETVIRLAIEADRYADEHEYAPDDGDWDEVRDQRFAALVLEHGRIEFDRLTAENDALKKDAERLDWLDATNKRFRMGWQFGVAPAGNVSAQVIIMGGKPIREAIDAAIRASKGDA